MVKQFVKALNFLLAKIYNDAAYYPNIEFSQETELKKITQSVKRLEKTKNKQQQIAEISLIEECLKRFVNKYSYFERGYLGFVPVLEKTKKKLEKEK